MEPKRLVGTPMDWHRQQAAFCAHLEGCWPQPTPAAGCDDPSAGHQRARLRTQPLRGSDAVVVADAVAPHASAPAACLRVRGDGSRKSDAATERMRSKSVRGGSRRSRSWPFFHDVAYAKSPIKGRHVTKERPAPAGRDRQSSATDGMERRPRDAVTGDAPRGSHLTPVTLLCGVCAPVAP